MTPSSSRRPDPGAVPLVMEVGARSRRSRWRTAGLVLGISFGIASALLGAGFLRFVASLDRAETAPTTREDAIVALTGGAQRIGDAIDLLATGHAGRLLITGVNERTTRETIAAMTPHRRQVVECCVELDYRARNTLGNAEEIGRWTRGNGFRSLFVVTSAYHMPRALAELDRALPEIRKVPRPVVTPGVNPDTWPTSPSTARLLLSEYVKYLAVGLRPRTVATGPAGGGGAPDGAGHMARSDPER